MIGNIGEYDSVIFDREDGGDNYIAYYIKGPQVVGAACLGRDLDALAIYEAMN